MAYNDLFGDINNCLGVAPTGVIRRLAPAGAGSDPVVLFAVGAIPVSITIFDVYVIPTAASGGGTIAIETNIAGAGYLAMTNAMVCAVAGTVARTALVFGGRNVVGPADAIQANKNADADAGLVHMMFYLT